MKTIRYIQPVRLLSAAAVAFALAMPQASAQKIGFDKLEKDCGRTGYAIAAHATFNITNTGDKPLVITGITPDCGCTRVDYPRQGIAPGQRATIELSYDARQLGHFHKQAAIYSNASEQPVYITITGVVMADLQDYIGNYPFRMGSLLTDKRSLEFDDVNQGDRPQQVIHIMNDGKEVMHPNVMHLPSYLTAKVEPQRLSPGHSGKITLTLNSSAIRSLGLTQTNIYLAQQLGERVSGDNEVDVSTVVLPDLKDLSGGQKGFAPKLQLSSTTLDLGAFNGKQKLSGEILLTNNGRTVLNISSLQMFTSGLRVTLSKRELRPGDTAKLKVTAFQKELSKARSLPRVLMITNDPEHAKVVISINVK